MTKGKHTPERIWAWKDPEYDVMLWNQHGDKRYTPSIAAEYVRADINADLLKALEGLLNANDAVQLVLCDGPEVPGFDPSALGKAQARVTEAENTARATIAKATQGGV